MSADTLPPIFDETRYYRLREIIGKSSAKNPTAPRLPIPESTWFELIKAGDIPPGTRLAPRVVAWHGAVLNTVVTRLSSKYAPLRFGPGTSAATRRPAAVETRPQA